MRPLWAVQRPFGDNVPAKRLKSNASAPTPNGHLDPSGALALITFGTGKCNPPTPSVLSVLSSSCAYAKAFQVTTTACTCTFGTLAPMNRQCITKPASSLPNPSIRKPALSPVYQPSGRGSHLTNKCERRHRGTVASRTSGGEVLQIMSTSIQQFQVSNVGSASLIRTHPYRIHRACSWQCHTVLV